MTPSRADLISRYRSHLVEVESLKDHVDRILGPFAQAKGWPYLSRTKEIGSYLQKLETGRAATAELDDALGTTIVVPTLADIGPCIASLPPRVRPDPALSKRTAAHKKDPEVFRFDDERLICRLDPPAGPSGPGRTIWTIPFELQVKTITQYAWGQITHPIVYKGERYDWRTARLSAQLRAMAEQVDLVYAEFITLASKLGARTGPRSGRLDFVGKQVEEWLATSLLRKDDLPGSIVRFAESFVDFCAKARVDERRLTKAVRKTLLAKGLDRSVTLFQFVIGVAATELGAGIAWGSLDGHRVLITRELEDLFPAVRAIPTTARVDIS